MIQWKELERKPSHKFLEFKSGSNLIRNQIRKIIKPLTKIEGLKKTEITKFFQYSLNVIRWRWRIQLAIDA